MRAVAVNVVPYSERNSGSGEVFGVLLARRSVDTFDTGTLPVPINYFPVDLFDGDAYVRFLCHGSYIVHPTGPPEKKIGPGEKYLARILQRARAYPS